MSNRKTHSFVMNTSLRTKTVRVLLIIALAGLCSVALNAHAQEEEVPPTDPVLLEIEREKARVELKEEKNKLWIVWIMPFAGMGFTLALLSIIFGYSRKADQNRHETIRRYLEKGEVVPERLLIDPDNPRAGKPISDRRKGVIWTSIGLGIGAFLVISSDGSLKAGAFGLIPLFIGIGYFVAARLDPQPVDKDQ